MIKAIFFDVDGTLLSHSTKQIPESTKRSLRKLREKGILVFMCTGRLKAELDKLPIQDVQFDGYATLNGQLCLDKDKTVLFRNPFPEQLVAEMAQLFREKEIPMVFIEEDCLYLNVVNEQVRRVQAEISSNVPPVAPYQGAPVYQASVYLPRGQEHILTERLSDCYKMVRWHNNGVDIIPKNGGKVTGIRYFLEKYHISQEEIMAFGDADNDLEMLCFAGIGVAMGNAFQSVKEAADYVTDHVDCDGIERALQHFNII